jgi:WD40 repeat protein
MVFDPVDEEQEDMCYVITVGWGRKIHIWADEKEEEVETTKILPQGDQSMGHKDDIMSAVYCLKNNLIYTGGHDGTLLAWNFETGYMKYQMHEYDKACTSANYIKDSKSVDMLIILEQRMKLLSMTADQTLRFWSLTDVKAPTFKYSCKHPEEDSLTAVAVTKDNDILITGDTSG